MSIINTAQENARQIIRDNIDKMHESSKFILEKETITGEQFMEIIRHYPKKCVSSNRRVSP